MRASSFAVALLLVGSAVTSFVACSAAGTDTGSTPPESAGTAGSAGSSAGGASGASGSNTCNTCFGSMWKPCDASGNPLPVVACPESCATGVGCTACKPDTNLCVGNEVHVCGKDGNPGALVKACDLSLGETCADGSCRKGCDLAGEQPSNVGCEFWAVDLDQQDGAGNDPASMPWGVVLANGGLTPANVTIEINEAPQGQPIALKAIMQGTLQPNQLGQVSLPTRELDCGVKPNDYASPGTCLSSRAFRITASSPIVAYQFNTFENSFSNDASLLLPTNALGKLYRVIGWSAGHPALIQFPGLPQFLDRSYVTIVGTKPNTNVKVKPSWRIHGNPPIAKTMPGGTIEVTIGPFDVLNLETDDATLQEASVAGVADLTGTTVESSEPVAVFSGVESTSAPYHVKIPTYPGWSSDSTCCLDHLEDQLFPLESIGRNYVVTRSPVRSTGSYKEPDVLRFVGGAATANVTTNLPAPFDKFTIQPGEVKDTWTDRDIVVTATEPVLIGQLQVSQGYVDGPFKGDPSLTIVPPVEQQRSSYLFLTPKSWLENWVVIATEPSNKVTIDGVEPQNCIVAPAGDLGGKTYEARRCPLKEGSHRMAGAAPFGIIAYGYGNAGSYAMAGGADVKKIYEPPPLK